MLGTKSFTHRDNCPMSLPLKARSDAENGSVEVAKKHHLNVDASTGILMVGTVYVVTIVITSDTFTGHACLGYKDYGR